MPSLTELDVSRNQIADMGLSALADACRQRMTSQLNVLNLEDNRACDQGVCTCMDGITSGGGTRSAGHDSYGTNMYGHRGDCGFRHLDTKDFNAQKYVGSPRG